MDAEDTQDQQEDQQTGGEAGEQDDGSFYLPQNMLGGKTCKAGDKITLEVVGTDDEGDVEVKLAGVEGDSYGKKSSFADDMKAAMTGRAGTTGPMQS